MWNYEKRLQYPINIKNCNPTLAAMIISQYGGPDGELGASMRYLSQRYSMPYREVAGLLTDIGTEELGHLEMVSTMVHQLTRNLTMEQIKGTPFEAYYVDHTVGVWPQAAGGVPFCAIEFQSKGDAITDIAEDMAAEQKARIEATAQDISSCRSQMHMRSCLPWVHRLKSCISLGLFIIGNCETHDVRL